MEFQRMQLYQFVINTFSPLSLKGLRRRHGRLRMWVNDWGCGSHAFL
jgi:hypothetical protein